MRAAALQAPNELVLAEAPEPRAEPGDLVLRVKAATICGTDIRILHGRKTVGVRYPSIIGHEFAGEVVEGTVEFPVGTRVGVCLCASRAWLRHQGCHPRCLICANQMSSPSTA